MEKVAFDGNAKQIQVEYGITSIDIAVDVYSAWKRWLALSDNSKHAQAFSVIGGEPTVGNLKTGTTFFLLNGWKIKPYEGNHTLTISGNLYTDDASDPITPTSGTYKVLVRLTTSNLIDTVVSGSGVTEQDKDDIATKSRNKLLPFVA